MSLIKTALLGLVTALGLVVTLAVFMPACGCTTKAMAYHAAMKSDLRNLVTAEEAIFARESTYTAIPDSREFTPSTSVTVTVLQAGREGYVAVATHSVAADSCYLYVGGPGRPPAVRGVTWEEAVPRCPTFEHRRRTWRYRLGIR